MLIASGGNVGIGTTINTCWGSEKGVLQLYTGALWMNCNANDLASNFIVLSNNTAVQNDGSWRSIINDEGSRYYQQNGQHNFDWAPAVAAAAEQTYTSALVIKCGGKIGIGTGTPGAPLHIEETTDSNTMQTVLKLSRSRTGGTFSDGVGGAIEFSMHDSSEIDATVAKIQWEEQGGGGNTDQALNFLY